MPGKESGALNRQRMGLSIVLLSAMLILAGTASCGGAAPGYLQPFLDPETGNGVVKITDPGQPICTKPIEACDPSLLDGKLKREWDAEVSRHHYNATSAFSADGALILLSRGTGGNLFIDGRTYEPLFIRRYSGPDVCGQSKDGAFMIWHPAEPDLMAFVTDEEGDSRIGYYDPRRDCITWQHSFANYRWIRWGPKPSRAKLSNDGLTFPIVAERKDGKLVAFLAILTPDGAGGYAVEQTPDVDMPSFYTPSQFDVKKSNLYASPSGRYMQLKGCVKGRFNKEKCHGYVTIDPWTHEVLTQSGSYHAPGHGDYAAGSNGEDFYVGNAKDDVHDKNGEVVLEAKGATLRRGFVNDNPTILAPGGSHTSCRSTRADPTICAVTVPWRGGPLTGYQRKIFVVDVGSGKETLVVDHRNLLNGYYTEGHATISPDGRRVIFSSNWGVGDREKETNGPIAAYIVTFDLEDGESSQP